MSWQKDDPLCQAAFTDLFEDGIDQMATDALAGLSSCKVYGRIKDIANQALVSGCSDLSQMVRKWGAHHIDELVLDDEEDHIIVFYPHNPTPMDDDAGSRFISQLTPSTRIIARIQSALTSLPEIRTFMGVHARGTDFGVDVDAYAQQMIKARHDDPEQKFLVCSEDPAYEQHLIRRFQPRAVCRQKADWSRKADPVSAWTMGNVRTSRESVMDTVADIYLLAQTDFKIFHESSALANITTRLSKNREALAALYGMARHPVVAPPVRNEIISGPLFKTPESATMDTEISPHFTKTRGRYARIYYFCPDLLTPSAGIMRLFRHVKILRENGMDAFILHEHKGFRRPDTPSAAIAYLDEIDDDPNTIFVIPEGVPRIMHHLKNHRGRRFVIALSWLYIFGTLPDGVDWRHFNIERVLAASPVIGDLVSWVMGIPVHIIKSSIDNSLYYYDAKVKRPKIAYIKGKAPSINRFRRLLGSRNMDYINKIKWVEMEGLTEEQFSAEMRSATVFLNLSMAEGFPTTILKAMACGSIVAGYDTLGSREILRGTGSNRNTVVAPNGDYVALAYALSPLLDDLLAAKMNNWQGLIEMARETATCINPEAEERALLDFWHQYADTGRHASQEILSDLDISRKAEFGTMVRN